MNPAVTGAAERNDVLQCKTMVGVLHPSPNMVRLEFFLARWVTTASAAAAFVALEYYGLDLFP